MRQRFHDLSAIPDIEADDRYLLSPAEQSELLSGHPWSRFVVLGDSIALGVGVPTEGYLTATWGERVAPPATTATKSGLNPTMRAQALAASATIRALGEHLGPRA